MYMPPKQREKIINELMYNTLEITFPDHDEATITEDNIASESMTLKQAVCDENTLKFGGCIASEFNIDLVNTMDRTFTSALVGKWISVKLTQTFPSGNYLLPSATLYPSADLFPGETIMSKEFWIFSGIIDSAEINKSDKNMRNVVAYDVMSKLFEWDATNYLYGLWKSYPNGYKIGDLFVICLNHNGHMVVTLSDSNYLNSVINEAENTTVRDFKTMNKSWLENSDEISYGEILKNTCEMIGLFGVIQPNSDKGVFTLKALTATGEIYDFYEDFHAEEFVSTGYTEIDVSIGGEDRNAKIMKFEPYHIPDGAISKIYDMTDNVIAWQEYDKTNGATVHRLNDLLNGAPGRRIYDCEYTPCTATLDGRLWREVGDRIKIRVNKTDVNGDYLYDEGDEIIYELVDTIILSRTITGIQALTDKIEAKGME